MNPIESKIIPPRGARGSNQSIIRAMKPAIVTTDEQGKKVLKGDSYLCTTKMKANSFWSSARKMGLGMVRRSEDGGTRCWVIERNGK